MWWIQHSKALTRQYAVVLVFMVGYACLPTGPVAVGEEELSVKGSAVDQDAQVAEPDSMPADVTDAALGLASKTFVPPPLKPGKEERSLLSQRLTLIFP